MFDNHPDLDSNHYVAVHIWTAQNSKHIEGHDAVGHVSLSVSQVDLLKQDTINRYYFSFWPATGFSDEQITTYANANAINQRQLRYFSERPGKLVDSLEKDIELEKGQPQWQAYLYSLNIDSLLAKVETDLDEGDESLPTDLPNFRLIGGEALFAFGNKAHNCSSFVYDLLTAGGIRSGVSSSQSSNATLVKHPDRIYEIISDFKARELKQYPLTKEFDEDKGMEFVSEHTVAQPGECSIL